MFSWMTSPAEYCNKFDRGADQNNPYLQAFLEANRIAGDLGFYADIFEKRRQLTRKYAWAVPDDLALRILAAYSPVIEIGAGRGYWAWQATKKYAADIVCYDQKPYNNHYCRGDFDWIFPVKRGSSKVSAKHPDHTLFLCWPPFDSVMAKHAIQFYRGTTVIYVGEGSSGCTADDEFHRILETEWNLELLHEIPQWFGIHDYMYVYSRKGHNKFTPQLKQRKRYNMIQRMSELKP